ncbi:PTS sugar transporter subunit IIA [Budvicia diplopodorum]|uniref:PTS sugar transporter subunit IIA n=1 Tax=Budvicia diplopodorum TaxID=1119056 RepID=UPI00135B238A|nr:PTS sugar transporter subunit IIA [Budvicia diplopodorum]
MMNSTLSGFISPSLIKLNAAYKDQDDFFTHSHQDLYFQQYVEASYLKKIIAREKEYPTGLATAGLNIAIPHTDPQYVKKPFVAITHLAKPLSFSVMGTTDEKIDVDWIFSLGVTEAENQIDLLQKLMSVFAQRQRVKTLAGLTSVEKVYEFFLSI